MGDTRAARADWTGIRARASIHEDDSPLGEVLLTGPGERRACPPGFPRGEFSPGEQDNPARRVRSALSCQPAMRWHSGSSRRRRRDRCTLSQLSLGDRHGSPRVQSASPCPSGELSDGAPGRPRRSVTPWSPSGCFIVEAGTESSGTVGQWLELSARHGRRLLVALRVLRLGNVTRERGGAGDAPALPVRYNRPLLIALGVPCRGSGSRVRPGVWKALELSARSGRTLTGRLLSAPLGEWVRRTNGSVQAVGHSWSPSGCPGVEAGTENNGAPGTGWVCRPGAAGHSLIVFGALRCGDGPDGPTARCGRVAAPWSSSECPVSGAGSVNSGALGTRLASWPGVAGYSPIAFGALRGGGRPAGLAARFGRSVTP